MSIQEFQPTGLDALAERLRQLRAEAGNPSYAAIATRIEQRRISEGADPAVARPGRTTVYDVFRDGRRRVDATLVCEIVQALGASDVDYWRELCAQAMVAQRAAAVLPGSEDEAQAGKASGKASGEASGERSNDHSEQGDDGNEVPAARRGEQLGERSATTLEADPADHDEAQVAEASRASSARASSTSEMLREQAADVTRAASGRVTMRLRLIVFAGCVLLNVAGGYLVEIARLPVFLDMIGTAVAAMALGPWWAVLTAITGHLIRLDPSHPQWLAFALVNIAGGLAWGYGMRWAKINRLPRFLALNIGVGALCTAVAIPVHVLVFGASATLHRSDDMIATFEQLGANLLTALIIANLITSIIDKIVAGFAALITLMLIPEDAADRLGVTALVDRLLTRPSQARTPPD